MAENHFDVIVIGGGGAGYAAASTAARLGRTVAMVERWKLGGTCLNVGCVPTKTLLRAAEVAEMIRQAGELGIIVGEVSIDFAAVMARKDRIIKGFSGEGPIESLRRQGIELLADSASFIDPRTLEIGGARYTAGQLVIATGSETQVPDLPGVGRVPFLTSDGALELRERPDSLVIVGSNIIGCELASFFRAMGTAVALVGRRPAAREDPDVGEALAAAFERRGIRVVRGRARALEMVGGQPGVAVELEGGGTERVAGAHLLLAAGRRPRFADLHVERAGVVASPAGIPVGAAMQTNVPHIWAAGDVTGKHMYTHSGDYAAEIAGWNAAHGRPVKMVDFRVVPRPIYSIPEVAAVGMREDEARRQGLDVEVRVVRYDEVTRPIITGQTEGFVKTIADRATGQILGAAIVGAHANDLIGEILVAMAGNVSAWTVGDTLHPYPTFSEVVRWSADQVGKEREVAELAVVRDRLRGIRPTAEPAR
ncbi:MAG: NAD(P)/FAD-dependent oxidoreductase [Chloroflexi bacterium]|nr:NAD(P)/FAD-dependent oxidoreductase [Chloroflexota bacterium]